MTEQKTPAEQIHDHSTAIQTRSYQIRTLARAVYHATEDLATGKELGELHRMALSSLSDLSDIIVEMAVANADQAEDIERLSKQIKEGAY